MIDQIKRELRISSKAFDGDVIDLIEAAKLDLKIPQINELKILENDPLIQRAIILYCKANFGLDNKDSEKYQKSYDNLVEKLSLSLFYKDV
jgi:uncharacterized phage protein (predicted DNA packaging)